jgi:inward rectifier potassium channel
MLLDATTKAGRRSRTGRSVYGKGTFIISQVSKVSISSPIRVRIPFVEVRKGIVNHFALSAGQDHLFANYGIRDRVARFQVQGDSYRLRDGRLRFAGQFAGYHDATSWGKEIPYNENIGEFLAGVNHRQPIRDNLPPSCFSLSAPAMYSYIPPRITMGKQTMQDQRNASNQQFDPGLTQSYGGRLRRIVNKDGSFNVHRRGVRLRDFHFYQFLIGLSWPLFIAIALFAFLLVNLVFTGLYCAVGIHTLQGAESPSAGESFLNAFFFSVQTLTTVGYGSIVPRAIASNIIASIEAMMGVTGFAFGAGLLYGRFSRPSARIIFSDHALIAPYQGKTSLQFRVANQRANALLDLEATAVLMSVEGEGENHRRSYVKLELERPMIYFLPLTWTIVHPIDEKSPLFGKSVKDLDDHAVELLVLIRGFDDTFSQVVNAQSSYRYDEILWGKKFVPAFRNDEHGHLDLDLSKIDSVEPAPLP